MAIYFKENGQWKIVQEPYIKRNGQWILPDEGYIKDGGTWKLFFKDFDFNMLTLQPTEVTATQITLEGALDATGSANGIDDVPDGADIDFEYSQGTSVGTNPDATKTPTVPQNTASLSEGDPVDGQVLKTYDSETDDNNVAEFELTLDINDNDGFALTSDQDIAYRSVATINSQRFVGPTVQASTDPYVILTSTLPLPTPGPDSIAVEGQIDQLTGYQQGNTRFYYQKPSIYDLSANTPLTRSEAENNALRVDGDQIPTADNAANNYQNQPNNPVFDPNSGQTNVNTANNIINLDNESDYQIVAATRPDDPTLDPGSDTDDIFFGSVRSFTTPVPVVNAITDDANTIDGSGTSSNPTVLAGVAEFEGVDGNKTLQLGFQYRLQGETTWQTANSKTVSTTVTETGSVSFESEDLTNLDQDETYEYRAEITLERPNKQIGNISDFGAIETFATELQTIADLEINTNENFQNTVGVADSFYTGSSLGTTVGGTRSGEADLVFFETKGGGDYEVTGVDPSGSFNGTNENWNGSWEISVGDSEVGTDGENAINVFDPSVDGPITVPQGGNTNDNNQSVSIKYNPDDQQNSNKTGRTVALDGSFTTNNVDETADSSGTTQPEFSIQTSEAYPPAVTFETNSGLSLSQLPEPENTNGTSDQSLGSVEFGGNNRQQTVYLYEVGQNNNAQVDVELDSDTNNEGTFSIEFDGGVVNGNGTVSGTVEAIDPDTTSENPESLLISYTSGSDPSDDGATITVTVNGTGMSAVTESFDVTATTLAPVININEPDTTWVAGSGNVSASSETKTFEIQNNGNTDLEYTITGFSGGVDSDATDQFSSAPSSSTTVTLSPSGGTNTVDVTYNPDSGGDHTGVGFEISSNASDPQSTINGGLGGDGSINNGDYTVTIEGRPHIEFDPDAFSTFSDDGLQVSVDQNSQLGGTSLGRLDDNQLTTVDVVYEDDEITVGYGAEYIDTAETNFQGDLDYDSLGATFVDENLQTSSSNAGSETDSFFGSEFSPSFNAVNNGDNVEFEGTISQPAPPGSNTTRFQSVSRTNSGNGYRIFKSFNVTVNSISFTGPGNQQVIINFTVSGGILPRFLNGNEDLTYRLEAFESLTSGNDGSKNNTISNTSSLVQSTGTDSVTIEDSVQLDSQPSNDVSATAIANPEGDTNSNDRLLERSDSDSATP